MRATCPAHAATAAACAALRGSEHAVSAVGGAGLGSMGGGVAMAKRLAGNSAVVDEVGRTKK